MGNRVFEGEGCRSVTQDGDVTFDFLRPVGENKLHFAIFWKSLVCAETQEHKSEFYQFFLFFCEFYFTTRGPCCLQKLKKQYQRSFPTGYSYFFSFPSYATQKNILILTVSSEIKVQ